MYLVIERITMQHRSERGVSGTEEGEKESGVCMMPCYLRFNIQTRR
jgi:hypothetical protein